MPESIKRILVAAYTIPTDEPESDGTLAWDSTTIVVARIDAGDETGLGYAYTDAAAARLIDEQLASIILGRDALDIPGCWEAMVRSVRNFGRSGIASSAMAAVDIALWDLKARLLGLPLASLLGRARESVPLYGSGGFTSYALDRLQRQLGAWADGGMRWVKMKVGRQPDRDLERTRAAREAIGRSTELMVDANGALDRKRALWFAEAVQEYGVTWFEEPVSSDDLSGLRLLRDQAPGTTEIAAGEYGYDRFYFRRMLEAGAVDVLQADITRCAGVTGFLEAAALARAFSVPLSAHTAPVAHLHPCCALPHVRHIEYFHDHVRIEAMLFDGAPEPVSGELKPELSRPGLGIALRERDADPYKVFESLKEA